MRAPLRTAPTCFFAVLLLTAAGCGFHLYEYQFKPKTAGPYHLSLNVDSNVNTGVLGNNFEIEMKSQQRSIVQYATSPNGSATAEYTFIESNVEPSIKTSIPLPPETLSPIIDIYNGMVGQSFTVMLDNRGRAVGIVGIQEMVEEMLRRTDLPAEARAVADQIVESSLGEQPLAELMDQMYPYIPEGKLDVGSQWESSLNIQGLVLNVQYSLTKREDGKARIEAVGSLSPGEPHQLSIPGLGDLETEYNKMEGSYQGFYILEEATGLILEFDITTQMDAVLEVKIGQAGALEGAAIPPVSIKMRSNTVGILSKPTL